MTQAVIEDLELIKIDEQHRELIAYVTMRMREHMLHPIEKQCPVWKVSQGVV